jgi:hypothetical protein
VVGVVLTGSVARGLATPWSDVDVHVVLAEGAPLRPVLRSTHLDQVPVRLDELERPAPWGSAGWDFRWSYAWAQVLRDETGGRVAAAVHRQATLTDDERQAVLAARLDGYLNLTYRALKSDRAGRPLQCRLDTAESVPWLLDVVFALSGRVRPYGSYLAWELRSTRSPSRSGPPTPCCRCSKGSSTASRVQPGARQPSSSGSAARWTPPTAASRLGATFDAWGSGLDLLRGTSR